jgi:TonB family protein
MKPDFLRCAGLALALLAPGGCQSTSEGRAAFPRSGYSAEFGEAPAGSLGDVRRKLGDTPAPAKDRGAAQKGDDLVLLVIHDAEGRPVYVETRRSSGDPALDRRAQEYVLRTRRFPRGAPNTVLLPLRRSDVPGR